MNHRMASPRSALDPCPFASLSPPNPSPSSSYARRESSSSRPPASIMRSSAASPPSGFGTRSLCDPPLEPFDAFDAFDTWPQSSSTRRPSASCVSSPSLIASSLGTSSTSTSTSFPSFPSFPISCRGNFMCASHLRSGKDRARDTCRHSPVFASILYIGKSRHA